MTRIVRHSGPMDNGDEGLAVKGTVNIHEYYVEIYGPKSLGADPVDVAGPFDEMHDALMAQRRIMHQLGEM